MSPANVPQLSLLQPLTRVQLCRQFHPPTPQLHQLARALGDQTPPRHTRLQSTGSLCWIARTPSQLVGWILWERGPCETIRLSWLGVARRWRGQGIAQRLLQTVSTEVSAVLPGQLTRLGRFLERCGWHLQMKVLAENQLRQLHYHRPPLPADLVTQPAWYVTLEDRRAVTLPLSYRDL